ncbi:prepilin-type N-terminal cleavage/methylation domain-containing protein [Candidatus Sumerlaeota bacterium]|nr:prepilin-type N-terminal cleavage/methylation domain-containing protein [Candidatus Sumerlaeota bacterium]MBI3735830.1 prepilin-type N-terminal cleavage/methylation domain-containing protein [Candidatus Sumerlaeota bacterium]
MNNSPQSKYQRSPRWHSKAFTLIELLIVVAIIAILAAIAVPNFLEAQVRAKVSRAKADMRTMATGIEAFYTDNNQYPDLVNILTGKFLTTPIAYLTSLPEDVFRLGDASGMSFPFNIRWYRYGSMPPDIPTRWALECVGPDTDIDVYYSSGGGPFDPDIIALAFYPGYTPDLFNPALGAVVNNARFLYIQYDPTNGTVSSGDIFRLSDHNFGN